MQLLWGSLSVAWEFWFSSLAAVTSNGIIAWATVAYTVISTLVFFRLRSQNKTLEDTLKAIKRQADLQEVHLKQWVATEKWKLNRMQGKNISLIIEFEVTNPTDFPMTIEWVNTTCNERPFTSKPDYLLPPKRGIPSNVAAILTGEQIVQYLTNAPVNFKIEGTVTYRDALERRWTQRFGKLCMCTSRIEEFNHLMISNTNPEPDPQQAAT